MERVCLAVAILIQGALAEVDGCIADPSSAHGCHGGGSVPDATSLLQRHQLKMMESAQVPIFDSNTAVLMKSRVDGRCLEYVGPSSTIRMESCHGGSNQSWLFKDNFFVALSSPTQQWYFEPAPIDCALSDWGDWAACSQTCGSGSRSRSRSVTIEPKHGGQACGETEASEPCKVPPCDCELSDWGGWTACSQTCGDSKRSRSRTVTREASLGGKACGTTEDVQTCTVPVCSAQLSTLADNKCLDYKFGDGNVYMEPCHGGNNQQWSLDGNKHFMTKHDSKCLDYNYNNGNVRMQTCTGQANQKWQYDGTYIRSQHDLSKCLDYAYGSSTNVYMHGCHNGNNQKWHWVR